MRCPICDEHIRTKARKCRHCLTVFDDSPDQRNYLERAFHRVEQELDAFEHKIEKTVGVVFRRHQFSVEDLHTSPHITKIESITGKIRDDLANWAANGMLSLTTQSTYDSLADAACHRLDALTQRLEARKNTQFEAIIGFLQELGSFLRKTLLPFLKNIVLINGKRPSQIPGSFDPLGDIASASAR